MHIILLSGGSGQRLWPLSNNVRSKQFIKIFKKEDGTYESMVQRVYRQIRAVDADATVTIATSKSQISALCNQLGSDVAISPEPARRDTFPAISLAVSYLVDVQGVDRNEPVVVCPVDPYVNEDYFEALRNLSDLAAAGAANLSVMGIEPTYPSEKYGYVIPRSKDQVAEVETFREKPDAKTAAEYIARGALWNDDLAAKYETVKKISFDYAVCEKEPKIQVMRFAGQWKDMGTWNTLTEAMEEPAIGNAVLNDTCSNTNVVNELNLPILCMGCRDMVIAASPEGILVSDKNQSSYIKPYVEQMDQQVMFAEKSWGSFTVLDVENESLTILVTLKPGHHMNYHSHEHRDEVWNIISGSGRTIVDGMEQKVHAGDVITMQAGCRHMILADTELRVIEVQLGRDISVHDKKKYALPAGI